MVASLTETLHLTFKNFLYFTINQKSKLHVKIFQYCLRIDESSQECGHVTACVTPPPPTNENIECIVFAFEHLLPYDLSVNKFMTKILTLKKILLI